MKEKREIQYRTLRWGPCVIHFKVPDKFKQELLAEAEKSTESYGHRLAGHLKKEVRLDSNKYKHYFNDLFAVYNHALGNWMGQTKDLRYIVSDLWCNFQRANEFNPPHSHGGLLSFVIYLKVPKDIKEECLKHQEIKSSAGPGSIAFFMGDSDKKNSLTNNSFFPEEGEIFIFPAWLKHWVYPYRSDAIRVSVSGNIVDSLGLDFMSPDGIQAAIKDIEKQSPKKGKNE